jgi:prevent-host-death family protein
LRRSRAASNVKPCSRYVHIFACSHDRRKAVARRILKRYNELVRKLVNMELAVDDEQIGIFEAKTHFSEVVDRVVREGRTITVTRRGEPVVDITPTKARAPGRMSRADALAELERLRAEVPKMSRQEILDLIAEGRPSHG